MRKLNGLGRTQIKIKFAVPNENKPVINVKPETRNLFCFSSLSCYRENEAAFSRNYFKFKKGSIGISRDFCANI